ncbi:MAG: acetylornithine/succinylornithine family transaminase [Thaumarchaeota archaeon]|nr:acetylornithine/succinylornithine family transaminase [Nitrososphaerota archaeon]
MPVALVKGKGALLWDADGKEYIDCMGGYGVAIVGHCNDVVVEAVKHQSERLLTCHGSFYNDVRAELLEKLVNIAPKGLNKVFLANSGTEAVECAIKLARKHTGKKKIVAMTGSFHGKTMGALSATWNEKYRGPFEPLIPRVEFCPFGNLEKAFELIDGETATVIVEPIQGESGIHLPPDGFLQGLREICDKRNVDLIFDEIQSGFARTGRMWASEHWNVVPDIMCVAKGMAGGVPMGAVLARGDVMAVFKAGDHSSTFGGNPLACAAASATIDYIIENHIVERAASLGSAFKLGLEAVKQRRAIIREVRGLGLMLGIESRFDVKDILFGGFDKGVSLLYSGRNIIRLLPPLVITEEQLRKVTTVIEELFIADASRRMSLQQKP